MKITRFTFYCALTVHTIQVLQIILIWRISEHKNSENSRCYTYNRRPLKVVLTLLYNDINQAIELEKKIKGWRRVKKEAFINGEFELLPNLSKNYTESTLRQAQGDNKKLWKYTFHTQENSTLLAISILIWTSLFAIIQKIKFKKYSYGRWRKQKFKS